MTNTINQSDMLYQLHLQKDKKNVAIHQICQIIKYTFQSIHRFDYKREDT